jgi:tRNA1Val (adenine37-N6)-methyltransferase
LSYILPQITQIFTDYSFSPLCSSVLSVVIVPLRFILFLVRHAGQGCLLLIFIILNQKALANNYFRFKQFTIRQEYGAMKVGTDGVLLGAWANPANAINILDIGTGTGLIAMMLAQRSPAHIEAIEIEPQAYRQALENVENCSWKDRIRVIHSSFQEFSRHTEQTFDLIVSNPPFFTNSLKAPLEGRNMARHNDILPPNDLLAGVDKLLHADGKFCLILPYVDSQLFIVDAALCNLYCNRKTSIKHTPGKKLNRVLMQFSRNRTSVEENELMIRKEDGSFTGEYTLLTRDYYLFL